MNAMTPPPTTVAPPTGIKIAYCRVSTDDQDMALQKDAMEQAGVGRVFEEQISGAAKHRPQLDLCLGYLRPGDTLVVWRLDRLGRSLKELIEIMDFLKENGVHFQSLTESIDTSTATGELVFHIFGAFAQFERRLISERTRAGLLAAKARGRTGGAPPKHPKGRIKKACEAKWNGATHADVCRDFGIADSTMHGYWRKYRDKRLAKGDVQPVPPQRRDA